MTAREPGQTYVLNDDGEPVVVPIVTLLDLANSKAGGTVMNLADVNQFGANCPKN